MKKCVYECIIFIYIKNKDVFFLDSFYLHSVWSSWWNLGTETVLHLYPSLHLKTKNLTFNTPPPLNKKDKKKKENFSKTEQTKTKTFKSNRKKCTLGFLMFCQHLGEMLCSKVQLAFTREINIHVSGINIYIDILCVCCFRSGSQIMWQQISRTTMWWTWRKQPLTGN